MTVENKDYQPKYLMRRTRTRQPWDLRVSYSPPKEAVKAIEAVLVSEGESRENNLLAKAYRIARAEPFKQDAEWIRGQEYAYIAHEENQIRIVEEEGVSLEPVPWDTPAELFGRYLTKHLYGGRAALIRGACELSGRRWDDWLFKAAAEEFEKDGHGTVEVSTMVSRFPEEERELAESLCDGTCYVRVEASWLAREENYEPGQHDFDPEDWTDSPEHFVDYTYAQTGTRFLDPLYADRLDSEEVFEENYTSGDYSTGVIEEGLTEEGWNKVPGWGDPKISFEDFRRMIVAGYPDLSRWDGKTNSVISAEGGA
jgi:hypothetical protein